MTEQGALYRDEVLLCVTNRDPVSSPDRRLSACPTHENVGRQTTPRATWGLGQAPLMTSPLVCSWTCPVVVHERRPTSWPSSLCDKVSHPAQQVALACQCLYEPYLMASHTLVRP